MALFVNGEQVDDALIDQEFSTIKAHFERQGRISCCERDEEFRGYARDNIVARTLLSQEARRRFLPLPPAELDEAVRQLKAEHGGETLFYLNMGLTPDQEGFVRENVETSLAVDKLLRETAGPPAEPTDADLEEYYNSHKADYTSQEEIRASHIFKSLRHAQDREKVFRELCDVREKLLAGADFEAMAREHSEKPPEEIDLGFYKRGDLMDEFEWVTFSMRVGEVSPVFGTTTSLHLAKVTDRKPPVTKPLAEVRTEVHQAWMAQKQAEKVRALVEKLKATATIENRTVEPASSAS